MSIVDTIITRRNIKLFKPDPIEMDQLISWLQAAKYAPNHRMTEPWEILFVGEETRKNLNHKTNFGGAPVLLAFLSAPGATPLHRDENVIAVSCFIQNFLLCAHDSEIGVGWSSFGAATNNRKILGVPDGYDVIGLLPVGYPAVIPDTKERTDVIKKIRYLP